jgi:hypothetical protein
MPATAVVELSTHFPGADSRATRLERIQHAVRRRAGRLWVALLVLVLLLPLLLTSLLGGH